MFEVGSPRPGQGYRGALRAALAAMVLVPGAAAPAPAEGPYDHVAVSEEIRARQRFEAGLAGLSPDERARRLRSAGWAAGATDRLRCALYVADRLTPFEQARLAAAHGVDVEPDRWIPPVVDRHPHGFHVATVPYAALDALEADPRVTRVVPLEGAVEPLNNRSRAVLRVDEAHAGTHGVPVNGSGVRLAVADSGIDPLHADLPVPVEAFDVTDGTDPVSWGGDVSNTVIDHGTHVTGIAVASGGLSTGNGGNGGGDYRGMAPGASLHFYKIGNDATGSTTFDDMVEAVERAAAGMTVFISAGNRGNRPHHASATAPAGGASSEIDYRIVNSGSSELVGDEGLRLIWRDENPGDGNLALEAVNLGEGESLSQETYGSSPRGTETKRYALHYRVPPGQTRAVLLRVVGSAPSGSSPTAHLYRVSGRGGFAAADPSFTVVHPAVCDGAVAVGAWTHRERWSNDVGEDWTCCGLVENEPAPFSSRGPRVDGTLKPDLIAPGASTISTRDGTFSNLPARVIDNDGIGLDGSGPADYYALEGTSMACPAAAGSAALLLEADPGLVPAGVRNALAASAPGGADNLSGHGLPDLVAALDSLPAAGTDLDGDWHPGSGDQARDCDDGNPAVWLTPSEGTGMVARDRRTFEWDRPAEPGATVPAFDVLRSADAADFGSADCIESSDSGNRVAYDFEIPAPGTAFHYLVRAVNGCPAGTGPVGEGSGGRARNVPACGP